MRSPRNLLAAVAVAGAAAFAAPGAAGAATPTICVHAPAGTPCDSVKNDLQDALDAAGSTVGADKIALGNGGFSYEGPFVYPKGLIDVEDKVTIEGVGTLRPVLTAPAGATVAEFSQVSLERVDVRLPSASAGIGILASSVSLRDVHVTGPGAETGGATGIRAVGNMSLDDVEVSGTGNTGLDFFAGTIDASRVRVSDVSHGGGTTDFATAAISRSKISARDVGLSGRGTLSASASVIETTAPNGRGVSGGDGVLTLDHVTVAHRGPVDGTDSALDFYTTDGGRADLSSVVLAGYTRGIRRDTNEGPAFPMTMRDSVWDPSHDVFISPQASGPVDESGNAHVDPALVDPAHGDFRLRGSSAAVDRDSRTDLRYEDVDGAGLVDGDANGDARADAGAYEYRRSTPSIASADVPGSGVTGQALAFAASGADPDGDALQFAWDFGDGQVGAGAQAQHAYGAPGIYTVTLHVTDEVGLTAARTFTIAVSAAAPATAGSSGAAAGTLADAIAPKLSKLRFSKSRRALRFRISERARVRITVGGVKVVKTVSGGAHSIALKKALRHAKRLPTGRVALKITATDAAGNRSAARTLKVKVVA